MDGFLVKGIDSLLDMWVKGIYNWSLGIFLDNFLEFYNGLNFVK